MAKLYVAWTGMPDNPDPLGVFENLEDLIKKYGSDAYYSIEEVADDPEEKNLDPKN